MSKFTEKQIIGFLKHVEAGMSPPELSQSLGGSEH